MKTILSALLVLALGVALPASAQQKIDFSGQATLPGGGNDLDVVAVVLDADPIALPLPLDFANFQYTLVFADFLEGVPIGSVTPYSGGTIALIKDDATPADFNNPLTFNDGEIILFSDNAALTRQLFTSTLGTVNGIFDWTAGTRISELHPDDRLGWNISSGLNGASSQVEPGYDEAWDGTVEPAGEVVANEQGSFGSLKLQRD